MHHSAEPYRIRKTCLTSLSSVTKAPLALFLSRTDLWTSARLEADNVAQEVEGRFDS